MAPGGLLVATNDHLRATGLARELLARKSGPYAHFAWDKLPLLVTDAALVAKVETRMSLRFLETIGAAALPLYDAQLKNGLDRMTREDLLIELRNVHGPKTARIMARYVMNEPHKATVAGYFAAYPELLEDMLADPKCAEDHVYLKPLRTISPTS